MCQAMPEFLLYNYIKYIIIHKIKNVCSHVSFEAIVLKIGREIVLFIKSRRDTNAHKEFIPIEMKFDC